MTRRHSRIFLRTLLAGTVFGSLVMMPNSGIAQSPDAPTALHERVWVEGTTDSDDDGDLDLIQVDVWRPVTDGPVPTLLQAVGAQGSPGDALGPHPENTDTTILSDQARWIAAGYAVATVQTPGMAHSQGCTDLGGPTDTAAVVAAVDFLTGRLPGYVDDHRALGPGAAWSNGQVALFGSPGSGLALSVAATGVSGLDAVVAVDTVTDQYLAHRAAGLTIAPVPAEDQTSAIADLDPDRACASAEAALAELADAASGDRNEFWDTRNHLADTERFDAPVLFLQQHLPSTSATTRTGTAALAAAATAGGLDFQVRELLGSAVSARDLPADAPDLGPVPAVLSWLDDRLGDGPAMAPDQRIGTERLIAEPVVGGAPVPAIRLDTAASVPAGTLVPLTVRPGSGALTDAPAEPGDTVTVPADAAEPLTAAIGAESASDGAAVFRSDVFGVALPLLGAPTFTARIATDTTTDTDQIPVTVALVLIPAQGEPQQLARGWADLRNHADERVAATVEPGGFVELQVRLPEIAVDVPVGASLALMVTGADGEFTPAGPSGSLLINADAELALPVLGGAAAWEEAVTTPVDTTVPPTTEVPTTTAPVQGPLDPGSSDPETPTTSDPASGTTDPDATDADVPPGEVVPSDAAPIDADPTAPATTDPATTDPATTDPDASDPDASDPDAADPDATDPVVSSPATDAPTTTEPTAVAPETPEPVTCVGTPGNPAPGTVPEETPPATTEVTDTAPAESDDQGTTPVETAPETTSVEVTETAPEPTPDTSGTADPVTTDPVTTDPVTTDPVTTDPVTTEPVTTEPVDTEAASTELESTDPVSTDPVSTDVVSTDVASTDPVLPTPGTDCAPEPSAPVPTVEEPTNPATPEPVGRGGSPDAIDRTDLPPVKPGLSMAFVDDNLVQLPTRPLSGVDQFVQGELAKVRINDGRELPGNWNLTGQVSDFRSDTGVILADNLGWEPSASGDARPGPVVAPGTPDGLSSFRVLCSTGAGVGGVVDCGGTLNFGIPATARTGDYTAILTLTLI